MDGIHDLGGMQGFGKVKHSINSLSYKPVFHEDWEHLAYSLAFIGANNPGFSMDELRHAIERMDLRHYLASPYYDRIIVGIASLLVEYGVLTQEDLDRHLGARFKLAKRYPAVKGRAAVTGRPPFEVGDHVVVRDEYFAGHVRMPGYVRGKQGVILHRTTEKWPLPDGIGHGDRNAVHQPTYHVQFRVKDLWGDAADDGFVVVDLFESYLDKVNTAPNADATKAQVEVVPEIRTIG